MKTSLVITVFNEEKSIEALISSVLSQTQIPDEIIIVDGQSCDQTIAKVKNSKFKIKSYSSKFKILVKPGNRSIGRNYGIKHAQGDIILITDAGCVLDKNWVKNITQPFTQKSIDVVAGYYDALAKNSFQKCIAAYVLVMPDRVKAADFLPASRSMAFRKKIWEELGGFPEKYSHNEDYVFARALKKKGTKIFFCKDAIVEWIPRENIQEAFIMFYRFAFGDAESGLFRGKVILLFVRFVIVITLFCLFFYLKSSFFLIIIGCLVFSYLLWAVVKNYRYVGSAEAIILLPLIQITADVAVLVGSSVGIIRRIINIR